MTAVVPVFKKLIIIYVNRPASLTEFFGSSEDSLNYRMKTPAQALPGYKLSSVKGVFLLVLIVNWYKYGSFVNTKIVKTKGKVESEMLACHELTV